MKILIRRSDDIFGMANLVSRRTGLSVDIWSDHKGGSRKVSHSGAPRIKITRPNCSVSVTIEQNPQVKAKSGRIKQSDKLAFQEAMSYMGRNHDLFLKHYLDKDDSFDDEDLFNALRERGEYK